MHNFLNTSKYSCRKAIIRIPMSVCWHFLACFVVILIISCPPIVHVINFEFSCFGFTIERGVLYLVSYIYHCVIHRKTLHCKLTAGLKNGKNNDIYYSLDTKLRIVIERKKWSQNLRIRIGHVVYSGAITKKVVVTKDCSFYKFTKSFPRLVIFQIFQKVWWIHVLLTVVIIVLQKKVTYHFTNFRLKIRYYARNGLLLQNMQILYLMIILNYVANTFAP